MTLDLKHLREATEAVLALDVRDNPLMIYMNAASPEAVIAMVDEIERLRAALGGAQRASDFVRLVSRCEHSGDEGCTGPSDYDDERVELDGLIAKARGCDTRALREILAAALASAPSS